VKPRPLVMLNAANKELRQSAPVRSIVQMSETCLLPSRSDLLSACWIAQYGDHPICEITLTTRLSDVGIYIIYEKVR
jgi:hypothetical protein